MVVVCVRHSFDLIYWTSRLGNPGGKTRRDLLMSPASIRWDPNISDDSLFLIFRCVTMRLIMNIYPWRYRPCQKCDVHRLGFNSNSTSVLFPLDETRRWVVPDNFTKIQWSRGPPIKEMRGNDFQGILSISTLQHLPMGLHRLMYMSRALIKQTLQLLRNSGYIRHRFVIETLVLI